MNLKTFVENIKRKSISKDCARFVSISYYFSAKLLNFFTLTIDTPPLYVLINYTSSFIRLETFLLVAIVTVDMYHGKTIL